MKLLFALLHAHKELEHGISGITVSLLTISNDYYCIFAFTIFHHLPDKVIYFFLETRACQSAMVSNGLSGGIFGAHQNSVLAC